MIRFFKLFLAFRNFSDLGYRLCFEPEVCKTGKEFRKPGYLGIEGHSKTEFHFRWLFLLWESVDRYWVVSLQWNAIFATAMGMGIGCMTLYSWSFNCFPLDWWLAFLHLVETEMQVCRWTKKTLAFICFKSDCLAWCFPIQIHGLILRLHQVIWSVISNLDMPIWLIWHTHITG